MQRVQSVRIKLSNGLVGLFWGAPIVEEPADAAITVDDVTFDPPRFISNIEGVPLPEEPAKA